MKLGVIMDPIGSINIKKDSTFEMLWQAQKKGWELHYFEMNDLSVKRSIAYGNSRQVEVRQDKNDWYSLSDSTRIELGDLDAILMRKDPPFDMEYIYATYILELAQQQGCKIINNPSALRDCNEKAFTTFFPDCAPTTLITRSASQIKAFIDEEKDVILKPLDGMGGASIFRLTQDDHNVSVVIETLTDHQRSFVMAQSYIPAITDGDKRILMINGEAVPYGLARIPAQGETRGNLAAGGTGVGFELSKRDKEIAARVGPELKKRGIIFAGLDVIGDYLTEVNVTSPTCIKEINAAFDTNIAGDLLDCIESLV
jgi:glutathione synthase